MSDDPEEIPEQIMNRARIRARNAIHNAQAAPISDDLKARLESFMPATQDCAHTALAEVLEEAIARIEALERERDAAWNAAIEAAGAVAEDPFIEVPEVIAAIRSLKRK